MICNYFNFEQYHIECSVLYLVALTASFSVINTATVFTAQDYRLSSIYTHTFPHYLIWTTFLDRTNVIQPMQLSMDGKMREINPDDLQNLTHNPVFQPEDPGSEDEAQ